jgi:DNA-binding response OmpR family regulator
MNAMPLPVLLLVEDEALILLDVKEILREAGFDSVAAPNGQAAMKEIETDASRFSAVVTDIDLGNGPTGWEVARRARELSEGIPIIYMSGASYGDWSSQGVPKSVMIVKPFAPAQLVTALATLITESGMESDPA